jgi:hypothetical protein
MPPIHTYIHNQHVTLSWKNEDERLRLTANKKIPAGSMVKLVFDKKTFPLR